MAFTLTNNTSQRLRQALKYPALVLEIEGVPTIYGSSEILEYIRVGDVDLVIGNDWVIGGFRALPGDEQSNLLSLDGSTTKIDQQLQPETGRGSSVTSMTISLIDKNQEITRLITPGEVVDDVMGRRCTIYFGFQNSAFPEDYIKIMKGVIDDANALPGSVKFTISSSVLKQRQDLFLKQDKQLTAQANPGDTTLTVDSTNGLLTPVLGPNGLNDPSLKFYVRINDELIRYTGLTSTTITGCTRAQFGTTAATHSVGDNVSSFYRLEGTAIDLALKIMLSGWNGNFATGIEPKNFVRISPTETVANCIFLEGIDVQEKYGIVEGDYVSTTGASNGANNVSLKPINTIIKTNDGSYIVVGSVTFVEELGTSGTVSFRSKYDTLGEGLRLYPDEVDILQHEEIQRLFLSSFNYDFYLKDTMKAKEFIEKELYLPAGAYSLPRKSKASVQYHIGPIPGNGSVLLNKSNIKDPSKISIRRSLSKNHYNTIIYKFDESPIEEKFLSGRVTTDATSRTRIPVGTKALTIESKGLRTSLGGSSLANSAAEKRLNRYKFAAEYFEQVKTQFGDGFNIEIGDIPIIDGTDLKIADINSGTRTFEPRFFEVINKSMDWKTGEVVFNLVDTKFNTSARYALISPSSKIKTYDGSGLKITLEVDELFSRFGTNEGRKFEKYVPCILKIRKPDFSSESDVLITSIAGNVLSLDVAPSFTPVAGDIVELPKYDVQTELMRLYYASMTDDPDFGNPDELFYSMI